MKKLIPIIALVMVILVVLLVWNPFGKSKEAESAATTISTAVVTKGSLTVAVNSTGVVEPILTVDLKSKASGEIIELPIEEGDIVKEGQLIARLDATTTRNDYDQAAADLEVAKKNLSLAEKEAKRSGELFNQKLISELDYENSLLSREQAKSSLVKAQTNLESAKERLSDTVIKSPINGIILKKYVENGQIIASGISAVSGGTTIATVADLTRAYIKTSVDEVDIGQIEPGQKATIIAESYPDKEFSGEVLRIHPQAIVEQNVTTFDVTIEVDNTDGFLMAGMNASVEIIAGFKENVLLIPREALSDMRSLARMAGGNGGGGRPGARPEGNGGGNGHQSGKMERKKAPSKMVVVIKDGDQEPRDVEIGLSNFETAEIISGLAEGDTVLTTVTSKALQDREAFLERVRGWNQLPGMGTKKK